MTVPVGRSTVFNLEFESTYGTAPSGNWNRIPVAGFDLGKQAQLLDDPDLEGQLEARRPDRDGDDFAGTITVPVDLRNIGLWLKAIFGDPATTGTDPYTHVFTSGADIPSFSLERGHPDASTAMYRVYAGCRASGFSLDLSARGRAQMKIPFIAASVARDSSTAAGTATTMVKTSFLQRQNSLKKDATDIARILSGALTYDTALEIDRYVGGGGAIGDLVPGDRKLTGDLVARFVDEALADLEEAATLFALAAAFTIDADNKLTLLAEQAELHSPSEPLGGPGAMEQRFSLVGSYKTSASKMMTVTLINDVDGY